MAQKKKTPVNPRRRDLVREGLLVLALAVEVLVLAALVTSGPGTPASEDWVGKVGAFVASVLYGGFGLVALLLVVLVLYTTVLALVRRFVTAPAVRAAGVLLTAVGSCTLLFQFWDYGAGRSTAEASLGGLLGQLAFDLLRTPFGELGTFVLSAALMCTGIAFATDWLLYEMAFDGARRATSLVTALRRFWPRPVLATGSASAPAALPKHTPQSTRSPVTRRPAESPEPQEEADDDLDDLVEVDESLPHDEDEDPPHPLHDPVVTVTSELMSRLEHEADEPGASPDMEPNPESPEPHGEGQDAHAEAGEPPRPVLQVKLEAPVPESELPRTAPKPRAPRFDRPRGTEAFELPSPQLLDNPTVVNRRDLEKAIQRNADILQRTLAEFRIEGRVVDFQSGPVVTMLEVALAAGTKVNKIHALADDLAMALKAESVRIVAPIPGKSTVGVEIPNPERENVRMVTLLASDEYRSGKQHIPLFLGKGANGEPIIDDLTGMPHLLLAGATGSGKSVCINTILVSLLMTRTPDEVKLILVDPKQVELAFFADIPHLLAPVVTDMKRATPVLEWAVDKMEERYDLLRRFEVRNIASYNELGEKAIRTRAKELEIEDEVIPVQLPYLVIIVDELADLMLTAGKDIEKVITRLAQKSRAVGIHIILATQRPSTDVITGLIKANMPTRIAFKVTSKVDSRVVLDQNGADKLLGMGDMLYLPPRAAALSRAQGTFVSDKEVKRIVRYLKERYTQEFNQELVHIGTMPLLAEGEKDELYDQAVRIVLGEQRGSASLLQRALGIGYTRASRLLDLMRKEGVVGTYKGSKASEVLVTLEEYEERVAASGGSA